MEVGAKQSRLCSKILLDINYRRVDDELRTTVPLILMRILESD